MTNSTKLSDEAGGPLKIEFSQAPPPSAIRSYLRKLRAHSRPPEVEPWPQMPYPVVQLTYWRAKNWVNFGDELSRTIVQLMLARRSLSMQDEVSRRRQLLSIGSIIHLAETGAVVWGSGINGNQRESVHQFAQLDVRAVRGPYTRQYLSSRGIEVPEVYGDPGLLIPLLTSNRFVRTDEIAVAFVPNIHDLKSHVRSSQIPVIDPRRSWNSVLADIVRCRSIVASSLHGLVIAEAFGIPARYVRVSEHEGIMKYNDYYAGTGRERFDMARSIDEALEMGGAALPVLDLGPLLAAFPYDLWDVN